MSPRILDRDLEDTRQPDESGCECEGECTCEMDIQEFEYDMEDWS
jgi:hypothetical protein